MAGWAYKVGDVEIKMSTDMQTEVRRTIDLTERKVLSIMENERDGVYFAARSKWPVKTGRSLRAIERYTTLNFVNGEIRAGVRLPGVEYARYIRIGPTWVLTAYLRTPMFRASTRVAKRLERELPDAVNAGLPSNNGRG